MLESRNCGLAGDGREIIEKFVERFAAFEVVEQILKWHASATEDRSAAENFGVFHYDVSRLSYARVP